MYLRQQHHDPDITDEEIADNILSGAYRLHDFATTMWLELTEKFISTSQSLVPPDELVDSLQALHYERKNDGYVNAVIQANAQSLEAFKAYYPELYGILCEAVHFRQICAKSEFKKIPGELCLETQVSISTIANLTRDCYLDGI